MATPYSDIYNIFLDKITDYDIAKLFEADAKEILRRLLKTACRQFHDVCREDLYKLNEIDESFEETLSVDSQEILAELMVVEWLKPRLYKSEFFENALGTKDFSTFSPANLLKEIRETYLSARERARFLIIDYSYKK